MRTDITQTLVTWAMAISFVIGVVGLVGFRHLAGARWGRVALLIAVALLPLSVSFARLHAGTAESSRTRFCLSCHEMQNHGRSLFVDDRRALPAVHYQNRLLDRDQACYACHTDYALFGDVKTKLNGLRHVWVHYFGDVPEKFALYRPYSNRNCLHCHEDGRRFLEIPPHKPVLQQVSTGEMSCLQCHNVSHDIANASAKGLWQAP